MNKKVAVFGASGLVGSRLCEILFFNKRFDFKAFINTPGNAYRIAKYPIEIEQVNLLDKRKLTRSLKDCKIIVNCSRGDDIVMSQGFRNLVQAAVKNDIEKVIHISSVLIYGEDPPPESRHEDCTPDPGNNRYGQIKLKQDNYLINNKNHFDCVILCPPNIQGPYSPFSMAILNHLKSRNIVLVHEGQNPCNVVHVDNLALAICNAVEIDGLKGERFFIKDAEDVTWKDYLTTFADIMGLQYRIISLKSSDIKYDNIELKGSILKDIGNSAKYFISSDFRNALSGMPLFSKLNQYISYRFNCMSPRFQESVRHALVGSEPILKETTIYDKHSFLINQEKRKVNHSIEKATELLGYKPIMDYKAAISNTKLWFEFNNYF